MRRRSREAASAMSASCSDVGSVTTEEADAGGDAGIVADRAEDLDLGQALGAQPVGGGPNPGVVALGEYDPAPRAPRPLVDAVAKRHRPSFLRSAAWTEGWTSPERSP